MSLLSVIVPCYNEEENVQCFYEELMKNSSFFEKEGMRETSKSTACLFL